MKRLLLAISLVAACNLTVSARPHHLELVGIGDSVTRGYGSGNGLSYFDLLTKDLKVSHPDLKVVNKAANGTTSITHVKQVASLPVADRDTAAIVTITSGGNDLMHNFGKSPPKDAALYGATVRQARPWIANYKARLHRIVTGLRSRFPGGCEIYICTVYDPTDGRGDLHDLDRVWPVWPEALGVLASVNQAIVETARLPHVHLIDAHKAFLQHGAHSADYHKHGYFWDNQEDLNDTGQQALHALVWPAVQAGLGGPSKAPQSPDTRKKDFNKVEDPDPQPRE